MNNEIIKWFELLLKQVQFLIDAKSGKEKLIYSFKLNSLSKSLEVLRKVKYNITLNKLSELEELEHIGKGTIKRIKEILETGKLSEVNDEDISSKYLEYINELEKIFGIGRKKALELYTTYKIKSIDDLKKAVKSNKIELPSAILVGLKYIDKIKRGIDRSVLDSVYSYLLKKAIEYDPDLFVMICGSYRRMKPKSNDIDVIITHPSIKTRKEANKSHIMKEFINLLKKDNFIIDSLTSDEVNTKYMGICKYSNLIMRIDIRFFAEESYYSAMLYFTGSGDFNKKMRMIAIDMDYTLNEYGLFKNNTNIAFKVNSEKEIFDLLNMEYLVPELR